MTRCHVAAILAAAFTFLLGVALARRREPDRAAGRFWDVISDAPSPVWGEPEDGSDPWAVAISEGTWA